jgi:3-hydroxyacyl-CoA dehydrogenase
VTKTEDGGRLKEVYDLDTGAWRLAEEATQGRNHADLVALMSAEDACGDFARDLMGGTLLYAADLVPQISDDIVNVDRAMRWGFAWTHGPFQMLDIIGPKNVIARLEADGKALPNMLRVLKEAGADSFYRKDGTEFLGTDGAWHKVPA